MSFALTNTDHFIRSDVHSRNLPSLSAFEISFLKIFQAQDEMPGYASLAHPLKWDEIAA